MKLCFGAALSAVGPFPFQGLPAHRRVLFLLPHMRPWSALVRAARAWRASTTPQPPLEGVARPFLIDPPLWASMEPADVRWALRAAVAEYRATWAGLLQRRAEQRA